MAEVLGLVASIIEVSSLGLKISKTLHEYGASVIGAEKRLCGLDKEIDFTSRIIGELGSLLEDTRVQALVSEQSINLARDAVAECNAVFQAMEDVIANIRKNGRGKWKIYFRESKIELLRSNLDRMKGNLQLLMGVIIHATQISIERPDEATLAAHRTKIRELMVEKEVYTQKYLEEKKKYLIAKINSTSTLGSISTVHSDHLAAKSSTRGSPVVSTPAQASPISLFVVQNDVSRESKRSYATRSLHAESDGAREENGPTAPLKVGNPTDGIFMAPMNVPEPLPATQNDQELWAEISTSIRQQRRLKRRKKTAEVIEKAAKVAGYAVVGTVAVALFPITIGIFFLVRRKRTNRASMPSIQAYWTDVPSKELHPWQAYHSADLPAELSNPFELSSTAPELDLIRRLTYAPLPPSTI